MVAKPVRPSLEQDNRHGEDRRRDQRGGRRVTDRGGAGIDVTCDGCGAPRGLEWLTAAPGHLEYRCRECRCRVLIAR
jgi:hypothetical protein